MSESLIEVRNLTKYFPVRRGSFHRLSGRDRESVRAVDGVSLSICENETLGLVGESGSGKTTLGRTILMLEDPTSGQVSYRGIAISGLRGEALRQIRKKMQIVFQNPNSSLDSRWRVKDIVLEPMRAFEARSGGEEEKLAVEALSEVGLPADSLKRFPHEFSGGQRQRIAIARALILNPEFVVLDEPTSALDSSVQAQILNLLRKIQDEARLSYLFITHNVNVVRHTSDRIAVMYSGKLVEVGNTRDVLQKPLHPYTIALISAVPQPDPEVRVAAVPLRGEVPSPVSPPKGCRFNPRCPYAEDLCKHTEPELREIRSGHWSACHFAERFRN